MGREGKEKSRGQEFSDRGTPPGGGGGTRERIARREGLPLPRNAKAEMQRLGAGPWASQRRDRELEGHSQRISILAASGPDGAAAEGALRWAEGGGREAGAAPELSWSCPGAVRGAALPRSDASWVPERPLLRWPLSP